MTKISGVHPGLFFFQDIIFMNFIYNFVKKFLFSVKKGNLVKFFNNFLLNTLETQGE